MSEMIEKCPVCGEIASPGMGIGGWQIVSCDSCDYNLGGESLTTEKAIDEWNKNARNSIAARLQAELATANETIRRNERSAAYQYEQYNEVKRENAWLTETVDSHKAANFRLIELISKHPALRGHNIVEINRLMLDGPTIYAQLRAENAALRAELEAVRKAAAAWKRSAKLHRRIVGGSYKNKRRAVLLPR